MKQILSLALSMTLALSLGTTALAAPAAGYTTAITVDGVALDTASLPATTLTDGIPMRAVTEAASGVVNWFEEEGSSFFALDGLKLTVKLSTGEIERNGEVLKNVKAQLVGGVTFVPAAVLEGVDDYTVTASEGKLTLVTPNSDPLVKLARSIIATVEMGSHSKHTAQEMEQFYGVPKDVFSNVAGFFPMMINADTVVIGQVAEGKLEDAKKALEAIKARTVQNFEQYLPGPLEMAKNGQVVTEGEYIMLIISSDNDTAIGMFRDALKG